jgi:tetratricopeptide (TPR) repeat protein
MSKKSRIDIKAKGSEELNNAVTIDDITYQVQTEDMGPRTNTAATTIYLKGKIVYSKKSNYTHLKKLKSFKNKLKAFLEKQHQDAIDMFISSQAKVQKRKSVYFEEVQHLLRNKNPKNALSTLREALEAYPTDPFLLSYYGCLVAVIENKAREGISICRDAIDRLNETMTFGIEFFYPVFYLNLGRAYIKGKKKKEAIKALKYGLQYDPDNHDILWEMNKFGVRRKKSIPFLERSNPANKYIGLILHKTARK